MSNSKPLAPLPPSDPIERRQYDAELGCIAESQKRLDEFAQFLSGGDHVLVPEGEKPKQRKASLHRTPAAMDLLRKAVEPCGAIIEAEIIKAATGKPGRRRAATKWLRDMDPVDAAITTVRVLLDLDRAKPLTGLAQTVGQKIFAENAILAWCKAKADEPQFKAYIRKHIRSTSEVHAYQVMRTMAAMHDEVNLNPLSASETVQVGLALIYLVSETTGFFDIYQDVNSGKRPLKVAPSKKLLKWLAANNEARAALFPVFTPMVTPPKDWSRDENGGYLFALANAVQFMTGASKSQSTKVRQLAGPEVFTAINHLQRTPWRINRAVLEVFKQRAMAGGLKGELREKPMPIKPRHAEEDPEAKAKWIEARARTYAENAAIRRKALRAIRTLALAEKLQHEERFYYACQYDFRGRLYYVCPELNPQGPDYQRALLEFAERHPRDEGGSTDHARRLPNDIPGHNAREDTRSADRPGLAVHAVGRFGGTASKGSIPERVEWLHQHGDVLRAVGEAPSAHPWWEQADDPWQFLATAVSFTNDTRSRRLLPLQLDATCSGFQHFAALGRDSALACEVNVGCVAYDSVAAQRPGDLYSRVAGRLSDVDPVWARHLPGHLPAPRSVLTRKLVKRPIVSIPYGATRQGIAQGIAVGLADNIADPEDRYRYADALGLAIKALVFETYPSVARVSQHLGTLTKTCNKHGVDLEWVSPSGFPVFQRYRQYSPKLVRVTLKDRIKKAAKIGVETDKQDKQGATRACIANVLQSLDASHMHKVAARCAEAGVPIGYIHDCILFPEWAWDEVNTILREAWVDTHRGDFLGDLTEWVNRKCGTKLEAPHRGDLALEDVMDNPFFFS